MKTSQHVPPLVRAFVRISILSSVGLSLLPAAELKYSLAPESENSQLGSSTLAVGDLNDDGIPEIAVADQSYKAAENLFASGIVYLLNGADGALIDSFQGSPATARNFGFSLAALNADGDALPDLAIGAPGTNSVWIHSGLDGSLIATIEGPEGSAYGSALANAGDHDGDGLDELYVGAPRANGSRGQVFLQSSIDGSSSWTLDSGAPRSGFGAQLAALDDINGDGLAELAVAAPDFTGETGPVGRVSLFETGSTEATAEITGSGFFNLLGYSLIAIDDANGDEIRDLMIGSYSGGTCLIVSGSDLALLTDLSNPDLPPFQPITVGGSFDADGDGISDWLIGSAGWTAEERDLYGGVRILSGVDQTPVFSLDSTISRSGLGGKLSVLEGFGIALGETTLADPETGGRGLVQVWEFEQFEAIADTDGDGVPDDEDVVIDSDMSPTLIVLSVDSGVENRVNLRGRTLADRFSRYADPGSRRQSIRYFLRINFKAISLTRRDILTRSEARDIRRASLRGLIGSLRRR